MNNDNVNVSFSSLEVGAEFIDPETKLPFRKICGNAAERLPERAPLGVFTFNADEQVKEITP